VTGEGASGCLEEVHGVCHRQVVVECCLLLKTPRPGITRWSTFTTFTSLPNPYNDYLFSIQLVADHVSVGTEGEWELATLRAVIRWAARPWKRLEVLRSLTNALDRLSGSLGVSISQESVQAIDVTLRRWKPYDLRHDS
jgi:hypothetical protein